MDINSDDDMEPEHNDDDDSSDDDSINYFFNISVFGRSVSTISTNSEDYVTWWITQHIHYPNCDPNSKRKSVRRLIVGLDIQVVDPNFPHPLVAALTLCVNGFECLVYNMHFDMRLPAGLEQFMTDPNNVFVGIKLERKLIALKYWAEYEGRIAYRNLGYLAARRFNRPFLLHENMSWLALFVLQVILLTPPVDPDWDRPVLLHEQAVHASVTAYVAYQLGMVLLN